MTNSQPTPPRRRRLRGRRAQAARRYVLARDRGICGICGKPGADTLGHKIPVNKRPDLEYDPANWQAEHGMKRPEYDCPGNYSKGDRENATRPSREW